MSATTGYYRRGLELAPSPEPADQAARARARPAGRVPAAAVVLPILALSSSLLVAWSAGLLGRPRPRDAHPGRPAPSILVVNALFFPGATDRLVELGPLAITREGLTFGLISAGRVLVAFLASVTFLFTTLADDLLEALIAAASSHRIAFVVLSAVQMVPRMQARAGVDPRGPAGARPGGHRVVRARASGRSCRSSGRSCSARSSTSASGRSRSRRAASGRGPAGRPIGSWPTRRSTAGCGSRSSLAMRRGRRASPSRDPGDDRGPSRRPTDGPPRLDRRSRVALPGPARAERSTTSTSRSRPASGSAWPGGPAPASRPWRWLAAGLHPARRPGHGSTGRVDARRHRPRDGRRRRRSSAGSGSSSRRRPTSSPPRS